MLKRVDGPPGPPWERALAGQLDELVVESELLRGNPLDDPHRRPLNVYTAPDAEGPLPVVYVLHAFTGTADLFRSRSTFEPSLIERIDDLFAGDAPPCRVVFPDGWARFGGSQWLNSSGTGPYMDYLCDEVIPFVEETYETTSRGRGVMGHSSGGYGALAVTMQRPRTFDGLAVIAPDALFEVSMLPRFPDFVKRLRDEYQGSIDGFLQAFETNDPFDGRDFSLVEMWAYALCYTPDEQHPGRALLPFSLDGMLDEDVWRRWLTCDPVRMAESAPDGLRDLKLLSIEAGRADEYNLDLGAQALSAALERQNVEHDFALFDGRHGGIKYRYPMAIGALARALSGS